jgi:hypothetical protein
MKRNLRSNTVVGEKDLNFDRLLRVNHFIFKEVIQ